MFNQSIPLQSSVHIQNMKMHLNFVQAVFGTVALILLVTPTSTQDASNGGDQGVAEDDLMGQEFRHIRRLMSRTEQMMDEIAQLIGPAGRLLETFSPSDSGFNDLGLPSSSSSSSASFPPLPAQSSFSPAPLPIPPAPTSFSVPSPVPVPSVPTPAAPLPPPPTSLPDPRTNDLFLPPPPPPATPEVGTSDASFIPLPSSSSNDDFSGDFGDLSVILPVPLPQFKRSLPTAYAPRPVYSNYRPALAAPAVYRQTVHPQYPQQRYIPVAPAAPRPAIYSPAAPSSPPYKRSTAPPQYPVYRLPAYSSIPSSRNVRH